MQSSFRLYYLVFLFTMLTSVGCNDDLIFTGSEAAKKIVAVVHAPVDSTIDVQLQESQFITDDTVSVPIENAEIRLYKDDLLLESFWSNSDGRISSKYRVKPDDRLKLIIRKDGYNLVQSEITIPNRLQLIQFDTTPARLGNNLGMWFTFSDEVSKRNFYIIELFAERWKYILHPTTFKRLDSTLIIETMDMESVSKVFFSDQNIVTNEAKYQLFNDKIFNGQAYRLDLNIKSLNLSGSQIKSPVLKLKMRLRNVNEEYYSFLTSLSLNRPIYGGPFSISSQVPGNITGGYGVFLAYTSATAEIKLK